MILETVSGRVVPAAEGSVDGYVDRLERLLRGPRSVREDLVAEVRDGLVDATEALEARGLDREAAECRAIAEFGSAGEIAAAFRTELGLAQARRTLMWFGAGAPLSEDRLKGRALEPS